MRRHLEWCDSTNHFSTTCPEYNPEEREHNTEMNLYKKVKIFNYMISVISKAMPDISLLKPEPLAQSCYAIGRISTVLSDILILKESYRGNSAEAIRGALDNIIHEYEMIGFCQKSVRDWNDYYVFAGPTIAYKDTDALQALVSNYEDISGRALSLLGEDLGLLQND